MSQDLADFLRTYDILTLIERDTQLKPGGTTKDDGPEYDGPCPFCGVGDDRFNVWPQHHIGRGRFWCRICKKSGDAISYLRYQGLSFQEAKRAIGFVSNEALGGDVLSNEALGGAASRPKTPKPRPAPTVQPPGAAWQARARAFVQYAREQLWSDAGRPAREYLHARGLQDETIRRFELGFNPTDLYDDLDKWGIKKDGKRKKVLLSCGVVIPCKTAQGFWYIQVRRPVLNKDGSWDTLSKFLGGPVRYLPFVKYRTIRDSTSQALFGADLFAGGLPLLFCEGEFDAMIAWQEIGGGSGRPLADVVAVGGSSKASGGLVEPWRARVAGYDRLLVAFDADKAGRNGAIDLLESEPQRARYAPILQGNDLTDFYLAGGDLRAWLLFCNE